MKIILRRTELSVNFYVAYDGQIPGIPAETVLGYGIWWDNGTDYDWVIPDGYATKKAATEALKRIVTARSILVACRAEVERLTQPGVWKCKYMRKLHGRKQK